MKLLRSVDVAMRAWAAAEPHREQVGIVAIRPEWPRVVFDAFSPLTNVHPQPELAFSVDDRELVDAVRGLMDGRVLGVDWTGFATFHSHVDALPRPSAGDRELLGLHAFNWIAGAGDLVLWQVSGADWRPWLSGLDVELVDG